VKQNTFDKPKRGRPVGTVAPASDAVKQTRLALGWNQQEMAAALGCALSSVARMEQLSKLPSKGAMLNNFHKLARRAGVSVDSGATANA